MFELSCKWCWKCSFWTSLFNRCTQSFKKKHSQLWTPAWIGWYIYTACGLEKTGVVFTGDWLIPSCLITIISWSNIKIKKVRDGVCGGNSRLPYPVPAHSLVVQSNLACVAGDIVGARKKSARRAAKSKRRSREKSKGKAKWRRRRGRGSPPYGHPVQTVASWLFYSSPYNSSVSQVF